MCLIYNLIIYTLNDAVPAKEILVYQNTDYLQYNVLNLIYPYNLCHNKIDLVRTVFLCANASFQLLIQ